MSELSKPSKKVNRLKRFWDTSTYCIILEKLNKVDCITLLTNAEKYIISETKKGNFSTLRKTLTFSYENVIYRQYTQFTLDSYILNTNRFFTFFFMQVLEFPTNYEKELVIHIRNDKFPLNYSTLIAQWLQFLKDFPQSMIKSGMDIFRNNFESYMKAREIEIL